MDNREIDVLVQREVFGFAQCEPDRDYGYSISAAVDSPMTIRGRCTYCGKTLCGPPEFELCIAPRKSWSTDISAAWEVVEWMRQSGYIVKFWSPNGGPYKGQWEVIAWKRIVSATGEDDLEHQAIWEDTKEIGAKIVAPTAPHAICLTALKLKGVGGIVEGESW